jgi:hypothetical protein
VTNPKEKKAPKIQTRASGKLTSTGMFDRVRLRPEPHPIEEIISGREPVAKPRPLPVSEPLIKSEPVSGTTTRTPSGLPQPPFQTEPVTKSGPVIISEGVLILPRETPHLRLPHDLSDKIFPKLKPGPRVVCERLYRLSAGFDSDECIVSIGKLATSCNMGQSQVRQYLRELESKGLIKRLGDDIGNKNYELRGIRFKVLLPRMSPKQNRTGSESARGSESEPIKLTTTKENTQTQPGVSVSSRFSLDQCRAYADHLKTTGQGITNPGGYSTKIYRSGEADALIEAWLRPMAEKPSTCPRCATTGGFIYVDESNPDKGVRPCRHQPLKQVIE